MNKKKWKLVATVGEYQDNEGNTKKRWQKCGIAFVDDEGRLSVKLEAIPCGPEFSGWLNGYDDDEPQQQQQRPRQEPERRQPAQASSYDSDQDNIPF